MRVAVIGTGASAIQVVPAIVDRVKELVLVQRTPAWVLPKRQDREIPIAEREGYRANMLKAWWKRMYLFWTSEVMAAALVWPS
jgi:cation diffusion facilitator CzcD-associated flavoprotein CzcO